MKKFMYFAAALLVLVGCNKNSQENKENAPENYGTIIGTIELPKTPNKIAAPDRWEDKTEAFTMQWEEGDEIYIYNTQDCKLLKNPSIAENIATFEGDLLPDMTKYKVAYGYNPKATGVTTFDVPYVKDNYRPFADGTGEAYDFTIANFGPVIGLQLKGDGALTKIEVVLKDADKKTLATYTMTFDKALTLDATTATKVYFPIQYKEDATLAISFYKTENSADVLIMTKSTDMPKPGTVTTYPELTLPTYVDLGLPSGLKWATINVGATAPECYGDYFAWGETEPYYVTPITYPISWKKDKGYALASYFDMEDEGSTFIKYNLSRGKTTLELEDDAARQNWGGNWRMPTKAEQDELMNTDNCTWEKKTNYNGTNVSGYLVTSTKNGNSIFLPAAGCFVQGTSLDYVGSDGLYWSSSLYENYLGYCAYILNFYSDDDSDHVECYFGNRYGGLSVRPVFPAN